MAPPRRKLCGEKSEGDKPIEEMRDLIALEKKSWVKGRREPREGVQKNGAEFGAGTRVKYCKMAETGHKAEPGICGSGTRRRRSLCWRVFDHLMRRTAPCDVNLMSSRQRWRLGSKLVGEDTVRLDFRRKEKKATVKRHQMAASAGVVMSRCDLN